MIPDRFRRLGLILVSLVLGALLSRLLPREVGVTSLQPSASMAPLLRPFDLMVLLGLMLVCALGIRALLPGDEEAEEHLEALDE